MDNGRFLLLAAVVGLTLWLAVEARVAGDRRSDPDLKFSGASFPRLTVGVEYDFLEELDAHARPLGAIGILLEPVNGDAHPQSLRPVRLLGVDERGLTDAQKWRAGNALAGLIDGEVIRCILATTSREGVTSPIEAACERVRDGLDISSDLVRNGFLKANSSTWIIFKNADSNWGSGVGSGFVASMGDLTGEEAVAREEQLGIWEPDEAMERFADRVWYAFPLVMGGLIAGIAGLVPALLQSRAQRAREAVHLRAVVVGLISDVRAMEAVLTDQRQLALVRNALLPNGFPIPTGLSSDWETLAPLGIYVVSLIRSLRYDCQRANDMLSAHDGRSASELLSGQVLRNLRMLDRSLAEIVEQVRPQPASKSWFMKMRDGLGV